MRIYALTLDTEDGKSKTTWHGSEVAARKARAESVRKGNRREAHEVAYHDCETGKVGLIAFLNTLYTGGNSS